MKNFTLAWRNLWRNRRRTLITVASVFFAVFFALIMRSLQLGSYDYMYKTAIESYSGYLQVQQKEWWDNKTVDNAFRYTDSLEDKLLQDPNVAGTVPRFESFALAASGSNTKGVMVMGIDPGKENMLSQVADKKVQYRLTPGAVTLIRKDASLQDKTRQIAEKFENNSYTSASRLLNDLALDPDKDSDLLPKLASYAGFENGDIHTGEPGAWIGDRLSQYLEISIGDTLVLMGQGYHGTTAAGKYEVKGIIRQPSPDIDNKVVYLPVDIAQQLYNAPGMLTSVALHLEKTSDEAVRETTARLADKVPENTRMVDWKEMNEVMIQQMEADNISGMFMIGILYLVIAFGIFGTVLMMTAERRREFGVLVAIGMQKKKLASVISYEMMFIGLMGMVIGSMVCIPIILYGVHHPIIFKGEMAHMMEQYDFEPKMVFEPVNTYFLWQAFVVGIMVLVALVHPVRRILGLKVVNALRA
jgi:putative ABC transport system permease protein